MQGNKLREKGGKKIHRQAIRKEMKTLSDPTCLWTVQKSNNLKFGAQAHGQPPSGSETRWLRRTGTQAGKPRALPIARKFTIRTPISFSYLRGPENEMNESQHGVPEGGTSMRGKVGGKNGASCVVSKFWWASRSSITLTLGLG